MERRSIAFSPPDITELEIQEVAEALRSGWITTGPRTKQLEKNLAEYCHTNKVESYRRYFVRKGFELYFHQ